MTSAKNVWCGRNEKQRDLSIYQGWNVGRQCSLIPFSIEAFDEKWLRRSQVVSITDRIKNWIRKKDVEKGASFLERVDHRTLKRMDDGRLTRRIFRKEVDGTRGEGRSKRRWSERVEELFEHSVCAFRKQKGELGIEIWYVCASL